MLKWVRVVGALYDEQTNVGLTAPSSSAKQNNALECVFLKKPVDALHKFSPAGFLVCFSPGVEPEL